MIINIVQVFIFSSLIIYKTQKAKTKNVDGSTPLDPVPVPTKFHEVECVLG